MQRPADGSGHEEVLVPPGPEQIYPLDWSPDGKLLAYSGWELGTTAQSQMWILPLKDRKPYIVSQLQQSSSPSTRFSPDGKWLAYSSTESGRSEVYVTPFPGPGGKWQVSTDGGSFPQWGHDGSELFYISPDDKLMSVQVKENGSSFVVGTVQSTFSNQAVFWPFHGEFVRCDSGWTTVHHSVRFGAGEQNDFAGAELAGAAEKAVMSGP